MLFQLSLFLCLPNIFPALLVLVAPPTNMLMLISCYFWSWENILPTVRAIQTICRGGVKERCRSSQPQAGPRRIGHGIGYQNTNAKHKPTSRMLNYLVLENKCYWLVLFLCLPTVSLPFCSWCWMLFASSLLSLCNGCWPVSKCCSSFWWWLEFACLFCHCYMDVDQFSGCCCCYCSHCCCSYCCFLHCCEPASYCW